jgi:hypothetical protein
MRKSACVSLLALTLLVAGLAGAPASAKSGITLRAQVPFDYHVGSQTIQAGDCAVIAQTSDGATLRISSKNGGAASVLTNAKQAKPGAKSSPRLVFHKYGDEYFLAAVWDNDETGRTLPESSRERSLRRMGEVAGNARMEVIEVAAR